MLEDSTDELVVQTQRACAAALAAVDRIRVQSDAARPQPAANAAAGFPPAFMKARYPAAVTLMTQRRAARGAPLGPIAASAADRTAAGISSSAPDEPALAPRAAALKCTEYTERYAWPDGEGEGRGGDEVASLLGRIATLSAKLPRDLQGAASSGTIPRAAPPTPPPRALAPPTPPLRAPPPVAPPAAPLNAPRAAQRRGAPSAALRRKRAARAQRRAAARLAPRIALQRFPPTEDRFSGARRTSEASDAFRRYSAQEMRVSRGSSAARMLIAKRRWAAQVSRG